MKRKRVDFPGLVELRRAGTAEPDLCIFIQQSSIETWLAIFWALEFGLGEITIVPSLGIKCRLIAVEGQSRIETSGDVVKIAFDRRGLRGTSAFLARCFYEGYPAVTHVDLPFIIDSIPDCAVVFGVDM